VFPVSPKTIFVIVLHTYFKMKTCACTGEGSGPGRSFWRPSFVESYTTATPIAEIMHDSPSCRGFIKSRLKAVSTVNFPSHEVLQESNDLMTNLSSQSPTQHNPQHIPHQLLPPPKQTGYNFRPQGHGLVLPETKSAIRRKNLPDALRDICKIVI